MGSVDSTPDRPAPAIWPLFPRAAVNVGLADRHSVALALDLLRAITLYAGTHAGGAFKSADGGESWTGPCLCPDD